MHCTELSDSFWWAPLLLVNSFLFSVYLSLRLEEALSEDDGVYSDMDPPNWQQLVKMEVLAELTPQEIKRQEVINGMIMQYYLNIALI